MKSKQSENNMKLFLESIKRVTEQDHLQTVTNYKHVVFI